MANRRYFDSLELFEQTQYKRPLVKLALVQIQKGFDEKCTQKADAGWPVWHSVLWCHHDRVITLPRSILSLP